MSSNVGREAADRFREIRALATGAAPMAAATAAGRAGETAVKATLALRTHARGTRTPSKPGQPPALISGDLRRSIQRIPPATAGSGIARTEWGSALIYARVQEEGARITAKNFPQLGNPTVGFFGPSVKIPARPFMEYTSRRLMYSGTLGRVAGQAFSRALGLE